jgi:hypothetical protein
MGSKVVITHRQASPLELFNSLSPVNLRLIAAGNPEMGVISRPLANSTLPPLLASLFVLLLLVGLLLGLRLPHAPTVNMEVCKEAVLNGSKGLDGAVDRYGHLVFNEDQIEGIQYKQCQEYCGTGWHPESLETIFNSLNGWLIPWLLLTAQLPMSARNKWKDISSVFLVIGSPILAAYSLFLTIYNTRWIDRECTRAAESTEDKVSKERMKDVAFVLSNCQQFPFKITNEERLLQTVDSTGHADWWQNMAEVLHDTQRRLPASLWAQLLMTLLSYIFTLTIAFGQLGGKVLRYQTNL